MKSFGQEIQTRIVTIGISFALMLFTLSGLRVAEAQLEDFQTKNPYVVSGQLFVVRVVPAGHKMQIYVVGNQVSELQFDKLQLSASMKAGSRTWPVDAGRKKGHFQLTTPSDLPPGTQPELNIKLKYGEKSENFDIKIDQKK